MKKLNLLLILLIITIQANFAQTTNIEIGIRFSPTFVFNRVSGSANIDNGSGTAPFTFSKDGSKLGIIFGPTFDIPFKDDRYYIGTGIFLVSKPVRFKATELGGGESLSQAFNTQYIQIPLTVKLFTDEVIPSGSLYFQLGGNLDFNVSRKGKKDTDILFDKATPIDIGMLFNGGFEYEIGNNKLFAGLTYVRGLIDAASGVDGLTIKNDMLSIDLGIKF